MANITSVKTEKHSANTWVAIFLALIGVAVFVVGLNLDADSQDIMMMGGAALFALGLAWVILAKPKYHLRVSSASGETDALEDKDKGYVDRVVTAINEALIKRG